MIKKIILAGTGGYGIKFLGKVLAEFFVLKNYNVVLTYDYDAAMRGGEIVAFLTYGDEEINNPIIDEADFLLVLDNVKRKLVAKKVMAEKCLCTQGKCVKCNFLHEELLERGFRGSGRNANMVALGCVLEELGFEVSDGELQTILPEKFFEKNLEDVKHGLRFQK
jgi:hypothetical protein